MAAKTKNKSSGTDTKGRKIEKKLGPADTLTQYMNEISKIRILTREEEVKLAKKVASGDFQALQELVKRNLKYVITVANKYRGCGLSLQDLIEEGNIGLIQAAKRFDPGRHVKFITYAVWWIRQAILHALAEQSGTVKLPVKQVGKIFKIDRKQNDLTQILEREPTRDEVARDLVYQVEEIESIMRAYRTHVSLDTPLRESDSTPYLELLENPNTIPYDDQIMKETLKARIEKLLDDLPERESLILRMRFGFVGESKTLEEIGKKVGLSRERVRQIEKRAKARLRSKSKDTALMDHII